MKFLKSDGTIEEGIQISDAEVERMERLETVLTLRCAAAVITHRMSAL